MNPDPANFGFNLPLIGLVCPCRSIPDKTVEYLGREPAKPVISFHAHGVGHYVTERTEFGGGTG